MPSDTQKQFQIPLPSAAMQIAIVFIFVAAFGGFGVGHLKAKTKSETPKTKIESKKPDTNSLFIETWTVDTRTRWQEVSESGRIFARQHITLSAELDGLITENNYHRGGTIKDPVIIRLDPSRRLLALEAAKGRVLLGQNKIDLLTTQTQRLQKLRKSKAISKESLENAELELEAAKIQKALSQLQVDTAQKDLEAMTIKGPKGYIVVKRMVEPGERIAPGQALVELADLRTLKIVFQAAPTSLRFIYKVQQLQSLQATNKAPTDSPKPSIEFIIHRFTEKGEDRVFPATIEHVAPTANPMSQRFYVQLKAPNPENICPEGIPCTVRLRLPSIKREVVVPRQSIVKSHGLDVVYLVQKGQVRAQPITLLGERGPDFFACTGVKEGSIIAKGGASRLSDGCLVKTLPK